MSIGLRQPEQPASEIVVLTTGGTIDKVYFDALSRYQIGRPVAGKLLRFANVTCTFRIVELIRKDSLDLTDEERAALRRKVVDLDSPRIVITHGTDTMTDTARVLASVPRKTIVLTGALSPARFVDSDAAFNLGMAFATAQIAAWGVYITMNGQVFRGDQVRKDRHSQRFRARGSARLE